MRERRGGRERERNTTESLVRLGETLPRKARERTHSIVPLIHECAVQQLVKVEERKEEALTSSVT